MVFELPRVRRQDAVQKIFPLVAKFYVHPRREL